MSQFLLRGAPARPFRVPVALLLLLALLCALGAYLLSGHSSRLNLTNVPTLAPSTVSEKINPTAAFAPVTDQDLEDAADHIQHAKDDLKEAAEKTRRVQQRIRQVAPVLAWGDFDVSKTRLDLADSGCDNALKAADRALEELDLAQANIQRRRQ